MQLWHIIGSVLFATVGCAHGQQGTVSDHPTPEKARQMRDLRLAQAQLTPQTEDGPQGVLNFEQMPNSMIVTFRVEGLKPRSTYAVAIHDGQDCESLDPETADNFSRIRTDKFGVAEGSFRSEMRTLVGQRGVVGDAVSLRELAKDLAKTTPTEIVCGTVEPRASSAALQ